MAEEEGRSAVRPPPGARRGRIGRRRRGPPPSKRPFRLDLRAVHSLLDAATAASSGLRTSPPLAAEFAAALLPLPDARIRSRVLDLLDGAVDMARLHAPRLLRVSIELANVILAGAAAAVEASPSTAPPPSAADAAAAAAAASTSNVAGGGAAQPPPRRTAPPAHLTPLPLLLVAHGCGRCRRPRSVGAHLCSSAPCTRGRIRPSRRPPPPPPRRRLLPSSIVAPPPEAHPEVPQPHALSRGVLGLLRLRRASRHADLLRLQGLLLPLLPELFALRPASELMPVLRDATRHSAPPMPSSPSPAQPPPAPTSSRRRRPVRW